VNLEDLVARGEALHAELGREYYLTGAGLKADPAFQAIYHRYEDLAGDGALDAARASGEPALLEWVTDLRVGRRVAGCEEEQLRWERDATLAVGGRRVPYLRAAIELQNSPDRGFRIALDQARAEAARDGLGEVRRRRFVLERETVGAVVGDADFVAATARLAAIDLDALGREATAFLADTEAMYDDALCRLVGRRLGVPVRDLVRADGAWLFRADRFDGGFPPGALVRTATDQMREMGLDASEGARVRFDTAEREGKQARAFCAPVRVPDEVYLVLRPHGGHGDYRTFWHELGHAMHYGAVDRDRPFQHRWLGDNSVTESFAMLWDHLTMDPGWLRRYSEMGQEGRRAGGQVAELTFELAVAELYLMRRYAGKLRYELELHRADYGAPDLGERYATYLTAATRLRFPEADALLDVDPGFYAARYLRAWQLEAMVARVLTERFDDDWYRNPRAGAFVRDLMRRGQATPAHRLADEVARRPLSFAAAIERLAVLFA
jgi:Peptidase family M3